MILKGMDKNTPLFKNKCLTPDIHKAVVANVF